MPKIGQLSPLGRGRVVRTSSSRLRCQASHALAGVVGHRASRILSAPILTRLTARSISSIVGTMASRRRRSRSYRRVGGSRNSVRSGLSTIRIGVRAGFRSRLADRLSCLSRRSGTVRIAACEFASRAVRSSQDADLCDGCAPTRRHPLACPRPRQSAGAGFARCLAARLSPTQLRDDLDRRSAGSLDRGVEDARPMRRPPSQSCGRAAGRKAARAH